jgi:hypothetical protein
VGKLESLVTFNAPGCEDGREVFYKDCAITFFDVSAVTLIAKQEIKISSLETS